MQQETKDCMQIYIPLILSVSSNGLTSVFHLSDYAEGFLQGMSVVLLCVSIVLMAAWFKHRINKSSK